MRPETTTALQMSAPKGFIQITPTAEFEPPQAPRRGQNRPKPVLSLSLPQSQTAAPRSVQSPGFFCIWRRRRVRTLAVRAGGRNAAGDNDSYTNVGPGGVYPSTKPDHSTPASSFAGVFCISRKKDDLLEREGAPKRLGRWVPDQARYDNIKAKPVIRKPRRRHNPHP